MMRYGVCDEVILFTCLYSLCTLFSHIVVSPCYDGELRLRNITSNEDQYPYQYGDRDYFRVFSGRVEVCYNRTFRALCSEGFGPREARIACRHLGYNDPYFSKYTASYLQNVGP